MKQVQRVKVKMAAPMNSSEKAAAILATLPHLGFYAQPVQPAKPAKPAQRTPTQRALAAIERQAAAIEAQAASMAARALAVLPR